MSAIQNTKVVMENPRSRMFFIVVVVVVIVLLVVGYMNWHKAPKADPTAGATAPRAPSVHTTPGISDSAPYQDLVHTANEGGAAAAHQNDVSGTGAHVPILNSNNVPPPPPVPSISPPANAPGTTVVAPPSQPTMRTAPPPVARPQDTQARDAAYKKAEKQVLGYMALWTPKAGTTEFNYVGKLPKDAEGRDVSASQYGPGQYGSGQPYAGQGGYAVAGAGPGVSVPGTSGSLTVGNPAAISAGGGAMGTDNGANRSASVAGASRSGNTGTTGSSGPVYVRAGTVVPALLLTPINSDAPGPVLAEITSGPFKGARLIGSFQATENQVVVAFRTLSMPGQPKSLRVDAFAVSADYHAGLSTDVNHHYLKRFGLTAAAAFVQGYGEAVSRQGSTTVVGPFGSTTSYGQLSPSQVNKAALGRVGEQLGSQLSQEASVRPTIKVEGQDGGSVPIGLLFMSDF